MWFEHVLSRRFGVLCACSLLACGGSKDGSSVKGGGGSPGSSGTGGVELSLGGGSSGSSGLITGGESPSDQVVTTLPAGFTKTDIGGFERGAAIESGAGGEGGSGTQSTNSNGTCGNILLGVVRDFKGANEPGGHPDFEANIHGAGVTPNLVAGMLGADQKPVYASKCEIGGTLDAAACPYGAQTTNRANFDEWYRNAPGVNAPYLVSIFLAPQPNGLFTFQSLHYFPVDGVGFKSDVTVSDDGKPHNFGFTTELHTQFRYRGGETFNFQGDDDVWVFINNQLAVDLGGLHPMQQRSVNLDQQASKLGIEKDNIYPLDLFHAERHTSASTFRIDTNLAFVDCGTVIPGVVK